MRNNGNGKAPSNSDDSLGLAERRILTVLAQYREGCAAGKLAFLAGYRWSGGFRNALSNLRTQWLIEGGNKDVMRITEKGLQEAGTEQLPSGRALIEYWLNHRSLGKAEKSTLQVLLDHPKGLVAAELCAKAGYEWSGGYRNALSNLRTAGLLVGRNGEVMRASDELLEAVR